MCGLKGPGRIAIFFNNARPAVEKDLPISIELRSCHPPKERDSERLASLHPNFQHFSFSASQRFSGVPDAVTRNANAGEAGLSNAKQRPGFPIPAVRTRRDCRGAELHRLSLCPHLRRHYFGEHYTAQTVVGIAMVVAGVLLSLPAAAGGPLRKTNSMPPTLSGSSTREGVFAGGGFPEKYFAFAPTSDLIGSKR